MPTWNPSTAQPAAKPVAPWQQGAPSARPAGRFTGRLGLGVVWFLFLAFCAALVWIATWISPPKDVALYLLGASYDDNVVFPPDCAGQALQRDLAALARKAPGKIEHPATLLRLVQNRAHELRTDAAWDVGLDTFSEGTLLMVVTGHGGADIKGAYVIPTNADARPEPLHRLYVSTILDRLETLPSYVKIVLIFDVTQMPSHWPLGMLHNDFAHSVKLLEERIQKRANLAVIVSNGPDQLSWGSHEHGKTIFGHYLVEGLRGGAVRDSKQKIDASDLYAFTRENVARWTRAHRAAEQTPMLVPDDAERAQRIILNVSNPAYTPTEPAAVTLPDAWKSAWQAWLKARASSPHVAAPHLWRAYQACLLQHEMALRFGDAAIAAKKRERLAALAAAIAKAQEIRLRSSEATLTMSLLAGTERVKDPAVEKFLDKFWNAVGEEDTRGVWNDAKNTLWKDQPLPVRDLAQGIVERLGPDKFAALERAGDRLKIIRQPDAPLPAEAHWLLMMARDLLPLYTTRTQAGPNTRADTIVKAPAEVAELFGFAFKVRLQAERAAVGAGPKGAAYGIELEPWLGAGLAEADESRLSGQDLLLSSRPRDWQQARTLLIDAEKRYDAIERQAAILRNALAARDRALAELPAYSHWLARRPELDRPPVKEPAVDALVRDLWRDTHALAALLQSPSVKLLDEPSPLREHEIKITKALAELEKKFDSFVGSLIDAIGDERHLWLETEAALIVPRPHIEQRQQLLKRQHERAKKMPAPGKETAPITATESARRHARREGEQALAFLDQPWFDRFGAGKDETYAQVQHRLERALVKENNERQKTIIDAGRQIGLRYRRMPAEIDRLLAANPKADLAKHRSDVDAAALLARRMEATLRLPDGLDPSGDARRLQLGMLLAAQARRTWHDHWHDENPTNEPYYRLVGRTFLADARAQMPPGKRDRWSASLTQTLGELSKRLEAPGEWTLIETTLRTTDAGGRLVPDPARAGVLTSEQSLYREFRLRPASKDDRLPRGYPVLWPEDSAELRAVSPATLERSAVVPTAPDKEDTLENAPIFGCQLASPLVADAELKGFPRPFVQRAPFRVRGLFRGQEIKLDSPVDVHPEPTTILKQFPLPSRASVAVRTDKELTTRVGSNDSGIAFILDCSGSMRAPEGADPAQSRFHQALEALRTVLQRVPRGTSVSVLTFGRASGENKTVANAEQTIDYALTPTQWNPQDTKQLADLMAILQAQQPWNESPISRTLLFAREDLKAVKGSKTIIAITDGHDNRFEQDAELTKRFKDVPTLLKTAFDNSDISVHMIVFPTEDPAEKKSLEAFQTIESLKPAGKIHPISDVGKLSAVLDAVLRQRLNYFVDRTGRNVSVNGIPETGLDVSTSDKNDRWFGKGLPVGGHKVRVQVPERVEKDILLHRGDLLLLDLVSTAKGIAFERYLFSDDYPWKRRLEDKAKDWRLSALQNQLTPVNPNTGASGLQMLLALEKTVDRRETILEQIKARDAWIELTVPPEVQTEIGVRIGAMVGYPAPAWSLDVPAWPNYANTTTAARPVVDVWWNPDEEARSGAELPVHLLLDERQRPVAMKGEKSVVIESTTWERHRVEIERGVFAERECLVVRLRHDAGRPILPRLAGLETAGAECRFYGKANKVAALFWFADNKKTLPGEPRLRLISVNAFKDEALQRGNWLQFRDLPSPEPTDFRPRAPIELK